MTKRYNPLKATIEERRKHEVGAKHVPIVGFAIKLFGLTWDSPSVRVKSPEPPFVLRKGKR